MARNAPGTGGSAQTRMNTTTPQPPPGSTAVLLQVQDLQKAYRLGRTRIEVLRGVDLELRRGEFVAVLGASGAGKSTLLHLLGGLDRPDAGRLVFGGRDLGAFSGRDLAEFRNRKVGFVFQFFCLLPELDALENTSLPARLARVPIRDADARARRLLERVGLKDRVEHKPLELSGGEQQRVAIARALVNQPELVLADEPTGNLDSRTGAGILDLLDELRREQCITLVVATHDAHVAARADRIVELVDGRLRS